MRVTPTPVWDYLFPDSPFYGSILGCICLFNHKVKGIFCQSVVLVCNVFWKPLLIHSLYQAFSAAVQPPFFQNAQYDTVCL